MSETEVAIYDNPATGAVEIIFFQKQGGKVYVANPVQLEFVEAEEGFATAPTLKLSRFVSQDLLQAFANELDRKGIKPTSKDFNAGELVATKYHLEDLRKLLKLIK